MGWGEVGGWLKSNTGTGAAIVGSLLTGNIPGALALGASLVSSATGESDPSEILKALQTKPETMLKLKELQLQDEENIRKHLRQVMELDFKDMQEMHKTTQETIKNGDNSQFWFVRNTRPAQSWASLLAAFFYVFTFTTIDIYVLGMLLTLPWAYAGLRQIGKGISSFTDKTPNKPS